MKTSEDPVIRFYQRYLKLPAGEGKAGEEQPDCPFCAGQGMSGGKLVLVLNPESFFHGYFRCTNRCVPGGFPVWFARLAGIPREEVPDIEPDDPPEPVARDFPVANLNDEISAHLNRFPEKLLQGFHNHGVRENTLSQMKVGYNGRYLVFPYFQEDGNCYSARCVHPDKMDDSFWQGEERFTAHPFVLYNVQDIGRCENGALFLCEGERSLLVLRQLGFPGVAVHDAALLEDLPAARFSRLRTVFLLVSNRAEAENSAKDLAARIGYRARLVRWPHGTGEGMDLWSFAGETGKQLAGLVAGMLRNTKAFSPFRSPEREYQQFLSGIQDRQTAEYQSMVSGFSRLDRAIGGIHGLNVIGGGPKVGKSTFLIQIASQMAERKIPVLYYDFENGRQKLYQRTLSRLSRCATTQLHGQGLDDAARGRLERARSTLEKTMHYWRVVNDRKVTPELMRRHIDFIRHETRSRYTLVVIDSLHKLPFKDFAERRTGIDAWLREMESIRDEMQVSFLVVSELSREATDGYRAAPHLGVFKGSGDIEYSADNAMVLMVQAEGKNAGTARRTNELWLVASREHSPGLVAGYVLDYPFWGFQEIPPVK